MHKCGAEVLNVIYGANGKLYRHNLEADIKTLLIVKVSTEMINVSQQGLYKSYWFTFEFKIMEILWCNKS